MSSQIFVGIDVANAHLDIALRPTGERWGLANDDCGIAALVARLQAVQPNLIVLEATGGHQRAVVAALAAAGLPVAVVNPRQARDVAKAIGRLAKTDALAYGVRPFESAAQSKSLATCRFPAHPRGKARVLGQA